MLARRVVNLQVALIGDQRIGKDFLLSILKSNVEESKKYTPTRPVAFYAHEFNNIPYHLKFWSLSGSADYDSLLELYFNSSDMILVCYDTSSEDSFDHAKKRWLEKVKKFNRINNGKLSICLVGLQYANKIAVVSVEEAEKFAVENHIHHGIANLGSQLEAENFFQQVLENKQEEIEDKKFQKKADNIQSQITQERERRLSEKNEERRAHQALILKCGSGVLLTAAVVVGAFFAWPVLAGVLSTIAATVILAAASIAIISFGGFLIHKITDAFFKPKPIVDNLDSGDLLEPGVELAQEGWTTSDIYMAQGATSPVNCFYDYSDVESDDEGDVLSQALALIKDETLSGEAVDNATFTKEEIDKIIEAEENTTRLDFSRD